MRVVYRKIRPLFHVVSNTLHYTPKVKTSLKASLPHMPSVHGGRGFKSHLRQLIFSLKNNCFGRVVLCCFVFLLCCVALSFFLSISWMTKVMKSQREVL